MGHIDAISRPVRAACLAAAFAATLALAGCGAVEFQGKVFDYMGVSGDRQQADVRMAERPPLLFPPDTKALPPPGNGVAVATARQDWPQNPEQMQNQRLKAQQAVKAKEQAVADPINPYAGKPTLLDKLFGRKKEVEQADDTPEPDPADKRPEDQAHDVATSSPRSLTPSTSDPNPNEDAFHPAPPDTYRNPGNLY